MRLVLSSLALALSSGAMSFADSPIWQLDETPSPLPIVRLVPGEETRVSLFKATRQQNVRIAEIIADPAMGSLRESDDALLVRANPGTSGLTIVQVDLEGENGESERISFPIVVEALPIIDFVYAPEDAETSSVALAGSFNGWSDAADRLTRGEDGIFRISKAISPGTYTYKFVVDGEWISDPANPQIDGTGYGNSILEVQGDVAGSFDFSVLSALMPGVDEQGGFHSRVPLDPEKISVIVNNRLRTGDEWAYDSEAGIIDLRLPNQEWLADNHVTIAAESLEGQLGVKSAPFATKQAVRSPRDEVIYFPMTDRFLDGNPDNNPPRGHANVHPIAEYHGGDWAGVTAKINDGYFIDLGITTLWISPPNANTPKVEQESVPPGNFFTSYHGYWPISSAETNPPFGSMEDLRELVAAAHERRIAVLLDFVSNHVHEDHPLYQADPTIAVPLQLPDGENNIRRFNEHPFTTWFDTFLPTLDYDGRPDLIPIMTDSALGWLHETGADGFRHDAVKHVPLPFWREITRRLNDEFERPQQRRFYQVGETISDHGTVAEFVGPDLLDGQFDFPVYFAIQSVIARGGGSMSDLSRALLDGERIYPPSAIMSPLLGNHDVGRFMAYADNDLPPGSNEALIAFNNPPQVDSPESFTRLELGFAFLAAIPGPPTIYYGDEIGMTGASDPDNRRSMKWADWTDQEHQTFKHVARLNHLRAQSIALRRGALQVLHADEESLAVARIAPEEVVLCVLLRNHAGTVPAVTLPAAWDSAQFEPLASRGVKLNLEADTLRFEGEEWSWGFWQVSW